MPTFYVTTTCFATVREVWKVEAAAEPTLEDAHELIAAGDAEFVTERAEDEEERKVVAVDDDEPILG